MAGHSKWANIQHRKGRQDDKRGRLFTRLIREITVAARDGGGDASDNPRLRSAIEEANASNMPKETILRAISRGNTAGEGSKFTEFCYEGYAFGGIAVLVICRSDNRNRTAARVRSVLGKHGGSLGAEGSVAHLFNRSGELAFSSEYDIERLLNVAIRAGAEDVLAADGALLTHHVVLTTPKTFSSVKVVLTKEGFTPITAEITMRPIQKKSVDGATHAQFDALYHALLDAEDVVQVYSNVGE